MRAGTKINVIPDRVELDVDIRTLPGWDTTDVRAMLEEVVGDLADDVDIAFGSGGARRRPRRSTPRCGTRCERVSRLFYPGRPHRALPDRRGHRRPLPPGRSAAVAYGFGLHSRAIGFEEYGAMFHGIDERVDVESLRLSTEMWIALAHDFLA